MVIKRTYTGLRDQYGTYIYTGDKGYYKGRTVEVRKGGGQFYVIFGNREKVVLRTAIADGLQMLKTNNENA